MKIKINETMRGKVPSCYVGKTFEVVQTGRVGDHCPSLRKDTPGGQFLTWDSYEGVTSTGRKITFVRYARWPTQLMVSRSGFSRGTWIYDFEIIS
jgi:hypothetical protein